MTLLIYLSGVIIMILLCGIQLHNTKEVRLTHIVSTVVYTILSWASLLFIAHDALINWMSETDHNPFLWHRKEN